MDSRSIGGNECGEGTRGQPAGNTGSVSDEVSAEFAVADAKEKLRLLTLQTLKYSTLWLIVRRDGTRTGAGSWRGDNRPCRALEKLEQWLVGFPCRVLIRYSHSEAQLVELITHAACVEQRTGGLSAATVAAQSCGKRRRLDSSIGEPPSAALWSPLEAIEVRSRNDHEWGAVHYRQAWFLQLFPGLNAFSASALLSLASLKHLIVSPYEELAPSLLGRGGGASVESLRDFCEAVRLEGRSAGEETGVPR